MEKPNKTLERYKREDEADDQAFHGGLCFGFLLGIIATLIVMILII